MADEQRTLTANFTADSSGFARGADEVVQKLKKLNQDLEQNKAKVKELNATMREYQKELDRLNRETKNGENATEEQTERMQELRDSIAQCATEIGTYQAAQGQLRSQINSSNRELLEQRKALDNTKKGFSAFSAAAVAAGGAAAAGLTVALTKAAELESAADKMSASVGASAAEAAKYKNVITDIYGDNFGDDFNDVADSVASVTRNLKQLNKTELKTVTEGAITLRDVFDYDVDEVSRAAKALVTNFDISATEAMDYIASGAQNGLDFSGEMLDSISEYSVQFAKMGLNVSDMFAIMQKGADEGAWNLDKVGDAVKEMSIRVIDGSKGTAEGFAKAGLSADEMSAKFAQGGAAAYDAFIATIDALEAMSDPLARDAAGVALLGTMWEDLGADVVLTFNDIEDASYDAAGAMEQMMGVAYDDTITSFEQVRRELELSIIPIGEELLPMAREFIEDIKPEIPEIADTIKTVLGTVADLIKILWENRDAVVAVASALVAFKAAIAIKDTVNTASKAIKDFSETTKRAKTSFNDFNSSLKNFSTTKLAKGLGALSAAFATFEALTIDTAKAAEEQEKAFEQLAEEYEKLRNKQAELTAEAEEYMRSSQDLAEIKKEYQRIKNSIQDTTVQQERLQTLQDSITDQYDAQAAAIDLVNGKYSEQLDLLENLYEKNYEVGRMAAESALATAKEQAQSPTTLAPAEGNDLIKYFDWDYYTSAEYFGTQIDNIKASDAGNQITGTLDEQYNTLVELLDRYKAGSILVPNGGDSAEIIAWLTDAIIEIEGKRQNLAEAEKVYNRYVLSGTTTHSSTAQHEQEKGLALLELERQRAAGLVKQGADSAELYKSEKQLADDMYSVREMSDQQYYQRLTELRDTYLTENTHEWYAATAELMKLMEKTGESLADPIKDSLTDISDAYKKLLDDIDRELEKHNRELEDTEYTQKIEAVTARLTYEKLDEFSRKELEKELSDLNAEWGEVKYQRNAEDKRDILQQVYTQSQSMMVSNPIGADATKWNAAINAAFSEISSSVAAGKITQTPSQSAVYNIVVQGANKTTDQIIRDVKAAIASGAL